MTNRTRRADRWTLTRRLIDAVTQQLVPGRHHTIWSA
jgi:hypothetical protein